LDKGVCVVVVHESRRDVLHRRYAQRRNTANAAILVNAASEYGLSSRDCLRETGIRHSDLADPDAEITTDQELNLVNNIVAGTDTRTSLGLRAGRDVHSTAYGVLGLGLISSATMRAALDFALQNFELSYTMASFSVEEAHAGLVAVFDYPTISPAVEQFLFARDARVFVSFFRESLTSDVGPSAITTRSRAVADTAPYESALGVRPVFGMPRNTVTFDRRVLNRQLTLANAHTAKLCERMCRELVERRRATDSAAVRVRYLIRLLLARAEPLPDQREVAAALAMSARSLRRELIAEGTSFRRIVNEALIDFASELLRAGARIDEIATRLGYSDNSAFSRAFKHSTGVNPSAYAERFGSGR
jgi:AraC-like DNA-binding protein